MILRPHSLQSFRPIKQSPYEPHHFQMRKKIQNFTFLPSDKIGRGYSSTVYKGENDLTKQPVAIKVIELKSLKDENTKKFLQNQLECLRKLDHPNVLRYINSFMTSNNCYIITELYNGGDLAKMLKDKTFFPESQIANIFNQFYQGYLHFNSQGFIHRDIKPSNILIQKRSTDDNTFVIADFGFVKSLDEKPKDPFNVGTPVYMAPESITSNIYTVKSDIWSMGVMLFEMAYGFLPFQCKNEMDLKREICNKEIRFHEIEESRQIFMSSEFKAFLLSCLRKNPQNRISLEEMANNPWFKKVRICTYDLNLRICQNIHEEIQYKPFFTEGRENFFDRDSNTYGYIGNQAIKRQKSLQPSHFPSKNHSIHNLSLTKNAQLSIDRHKQKARQLGLLTLRNNSKEHTLQIKSPEPYFAQQYLKEKLRIDNKNSNSPQLSNFIDKKNGVDRRSSMLEGMKGIVNIKNSHILRINQSNQIKSDQKRRQSFKKMETVKTLLQASTSIQDTKTNSSESIKMNKPIDTLNSAQINSFRGLSPCDVSNLLSIQTEQSFRDKNTDNIIDYPTNRTTLEENNSFILSAIPQSLASINPEQNPKKSPSQKKHIMPKDFYVKSMHFMRFIFENLNNLFEFNGDKEIFNQVKNILEEFLFSHLVKIKASLDNKLNLFRLHKWEEFCSNDNFLTFTDVIEKYYKKYTQSSVLKRVFNDANIKSVGRQKVNKYRAESYKLLKLAEELSAANKEVVKKSIRNSSSFNGSIGMIYHIQKALEMVIVFNEFEDNQVKLFEVNPQKDLNDMNTKVKDPFKIPKMVIQMKKKLIALESGNYEQRNEITNKENIFVSENLMTDPIRRISFK